MSLYFPKLFQKHASFLFKNNACTTTGMNKNCRCFHNACFAVLFREPLITPGVFPFDSRTSKNHDEVAVGFRAGRTDEPRQGRKTATVLLCVGAAECLAAFFEKPSCPVMQRARGRCYSSRVFPGFVCLLLFEIVFDKQIVLRLSKKFSAFFKREKLPYCIFRINSSARFKSSAVSMEHSGCVSTGNVAMR